MRSSDGRLTELAWKYGLNCQIRFISLWAHQEVRWRKKRCYILSVQTYVRGIHTADGKERGGVYNS